MGPVPDSQDTLPSPSTFHLGLPRKALTGERGHVETDLNLLRDKIEPYTLPLHRRRVLKVISVLPLPPCTAVSSEHRLFCRHYLPITQKWAEIFSTFPDSLTTIPFSA